MNSLRNSIWLQVVSIGGQEVPSVCWFSESKSVPRSLRFQGVSPLPNPTYFWSSTLISRRDMYDSWENSSSEYFKVPYHYFIKNEHGHQKYSYESDTGAAWGVGVLTFRSQNTVELPVPIESVYFEFIRNVPGPANRCSFVKQHPGSEQQNRRIIADIKDENARTSNADLLGSLMQYF